jgi:hypothetical protein
MGSFSDLIYLEESGHFFVAAYLSLLSKQPLSVHSVSKHKSLDLGLPSRNRSFYYLE